MAQDVSFAPLTGALVRRAGTSFDDDYRNGGAAKHEPARAAGGWRDDLRLFAVTWAAGFVFFLTFLA